MPDEQVLAWLKAKARVTDAEEQLSDMLDKAETLLRSLRDQPSTPFDPKSWPEGFFDSIHITDPAFDRPEQSQLRS